MSILDIIVIGIVISFTLVSALWGVVRQMIALAGLVLGIFLAGALNAPLAGALGFINNPSVAKGIAFVFVVVVISGLASLVASILYFVTGLLFLGLLDHMLGAVLGFFQGVLALGVFFVAMLTIFPEWTTQQLGQSFLANQLIGALTTLTLVLAPPELKDIVERARLQL